MRVFLLLIAISFSLSSYSATCTNMVTTIGDGVSVDPPDKVFLFAGQSNMVGLGDTRSLTYSTAVPGVVVWTGTQWENYSPNGCFGPDLSFMIKWSEAHPGRRIGVVKTAVGGSSMERWQVDGDLYNMMIATWTESGRLPVEGFIWMQGEADALIYQYSQNYTWRFANLIVNIHSITGNAPFVYGHTHTYWFNYWSYVHEAQYTAQFWQKCNMVFTLDLPLQADGLHFTTQGQITFGQRLYSDWVAIR